MHLIDIKAKCIRDSAWYPVCDTIPISRRRQPCREGCPPGWSGTPAALSVRLEYRAGATAERAAADFSSTPSRSATARHLATCGGSPRESDKGIMAAGAEDDVLEFNLTIRVLVTVKTFYREGFFAPKGISHPGRRSRKLPEGAMKPTNNPCEHIARKTARRTKQVANETFKYSAQVCTEAPVLEFWNLTPDTSSGSGCRSRRRTSSRSRR